MKKYILIIFVLISLLSPWNLYAAYYYVEEGGSGDGSACGNAYSVAQFNADAMSLAAGDTIYFCSDGGTFTTKVYPVVAGSAVGGYITYTAAPGSSPVFGDASDHSFVFNGDDDYSIIDGLTFQDTSGTTTLNDEVAPTDYAGIFVGSSQGEMDHITIQNCTFTGTTNDIGWPIRVMTQSDNNIHDITISSNTFTHWRDDNIYIDINGGQSGYLYNITIDGNTFTGSDAVYRPYRTIYFAGEEADVCMDGNADGECDAGEEGFGAYGVTISNNTATYTSHAFIAVRTGFRDNTANTISGNTVTYCGLASVNNVNCMQLNWIRGTTISDNIISVTETGNCDGAAIILDWAYSDSDCLSDSNTVTRNTVFNNQSSGCGAGEGKGIWNLWATNSTITYNISYANGRGVQQSHPESTGSKWYNNILYDNTHQQVRCDDPALAEVDCGEWRNNIFMESAQSGTYGILIANDNDDTVDEQYNIFYGFDDAAHKIYRSSDSQTLSLHASDIESDPSFVDASNANFKVTPLSPAINAGSDVYGANQQDYAGVYVTDASGDPILGGAIDIGAYEMAFASGSFNVSGNMTLDF